MQSVDLPHTGTQSVGVDRSSPVYLTVRRVCDLVLSLLAFVFTLPVLVLACLAVVAESKGTPIYTQVRVGRCGSLFKIYKIRTMLSATDQLSCVTMIDDPRVTRVGAFLRATKLDELPQLLNVILGQMSIIGPRPLSQAECNHIRQSGFADTTPGFIPVGLPGLVGLEQISRDRELDYAERFRLNALYEANRCWQLDLQIILRAIVLCKIVVYCVMAGVIGELTIMNVFDGGIMSWPPR